VLLAGGEQAEVLRLHAESAQAWSRKFEAKICALAGAGSKARFAVLDARGRLTCVDLLSGREQQTQFELHPRQEGDDSAAALGLSKAGDAVIVARTVPETRQVLAEILDWGDGLSAIQGTVAIDIDNYGGVYWAGFAVDPTRFGALCGSALHVFDREGRPVDKLAGSAKYSSCVAPDLSSFSTPEFDLVQLFRRQSGSEGSQEQEAIVLEGAKGTLMEATFIGDDATVRCRLPISLPTACAAGSGRRCTLAPLTGSSRVREARGVNRGRAAF